MQHVSKFVGQRKREGLSDTTIHHDRDVLHHVYAWAVENEFILSSPISKMKLIEEQCVERRRPDESFIDEIFAKLDPRTVPVFAFIRDTGARRGEAINLQRRQLDMARAEVVFTFTKNGKSRRVPLTDLGIWAVQAMPTVSDWVFYDPDTLKPWTGDAVALRWERARKCAGHPWLWIHDLRATRTR